MKTIGDRIRQARLAKGWSAGYLASLAGYKTQSGIANLENKATGSGGNNIRQIAAALEVSTDWLLNGPDCEVVPFMVESPTRKEPEKIDLPLVDVRRTYNIVTNTHLVGWPFKAFSLQQWMSVPDDKRAFIEEIMANAVAQVQKITNTMPSAAHSI